MHATNMVMKLEFAAKLQMVSQFWHFVVWVTKGTCDGTCICVRVTILNRYIKPVLRRTICVRFSWWATGQIFHIIRFLGIQEYYFGVSNFRFLVISVRAQDVSLVIRTLTLSKPVFIINKRVVNICNKYI